MVGETEGSRSRIFPVPLHPQPTSHKVIRDRTPRLYGEKLQSKHLNSATTYFRLHVPAKIIQTQCETRFNSYGSTLRREIGK